MATKIMYRQLHLINGSIHLHDWQMSGYVTLDEIHVHYDDQLKDEHRQMILDGIEKRKQDLNKELILLDKKKQDLLCITYNVVQEPHAPDSDFTKVTYIKTDNSSPMWMEAQYTPENINGELHIDWA